jgi:hypothetical protein
VDLHQSFGYIDTRNTPSHLPFARRKKARGARVRGAEQGDVVVSFRCRYNIQVSIGARECRHTSGYRVYVLVLDRKQSD